MLASLMISMLCYAALSGFAGEGLAAIRGQTSSTTEGLEEVGVSHAPLPLVITNSSR